ncbi:MAG: carbon storage regulator CsrA [Syntrophales bacterium]|nr:carbon storage regulator CsrA [Syntrophales bacterium]
MLVLTRRLGEKVMIGDEISVTIMEIKGNQVKIGIEAPRHIAIHREEVYLMIKEQNEMAVAVKVDPITVWERMGRKGQE